MFIRDLQIIDGSNPGPLASALDVFAIQVVELYLSHVARKVRTDGTAKVVVVLRPATTHAAPFGRGTDVLQLDWPFDFGKLNGSEDGQKKRIMLDTLHRALFWLARERRWTTLPFEQAYSASLEAGLVFSGWLLKRPVKHPKLRVAANCYFECVNDRVDVHAVVLAPGKGEVGRKHFYSTTTRYDAPRRLIDRLVWVSQNKLKTFPGRGSWGEESHVLDVSDVLLQNATRA
jgi:hypothetical protein